MANVDITGTILDAAGEPVEDVVVRLSPAPVSVDSPEAIGGIGIVLDPVEVYTAADGTFTMPAVQGFTYTLEISAIGLKERFRAPAVPTIEFHLLGLVPELRSAKDFVDADGTQHVLVQIITRRIETVLERFDQLVVESAPAIAGPWAEIGASPVTLLSNQDSYELDDDAPEMYYRARYTNSATGDESDNSDPVLGDAFREALLLTVAEFKDVYLFGIDLTGDDGTPYPTLMYEWYIRAATQWLEHELDIKLVAHNVVDELHDHYAQDYGRWGYFQLKEYPVIRLDAVRFQYPSMTEGVDIDLSWTVLEDEGAHGVVQIVPGQGNIADVLLIPGSLMPMWSGAYGRVPGVWRMSYRAGFEVEDIPYDLKHLIGMMASLGIMNVAGDLVGGSGLQGWSVSIPGLSQNVTTTNSSTNAGFGARIIEYTKEIKMLLPVAKRFYGKTAKLVVV